MREKLDNLKIKWQGFEHKRAAVLITSAVLLFAIIFGVFFYTRSTQPDFPIFYQKGDKLYARAAHSPSSSVVTREYTEEQEPYVKLSSNGERMFFVDDFTLDGKTANYTLRMYEGNASWLNGERNSLVSKNVTGDYLVNAAGTLVYYMVSVEGGSPVLKVFNCESQRSDQLADNAVDFKILSLNGSVYYKTDDEKLYRSSQDGSVYIMDFVHDFYIYESEDGNVTEVFCLRETDKDGLFELFFIRDNEKPRSVAKNVTGARFSEYMQGGSLYYFTPSTVKLNWKDWIDDDLAQSDSQMNEPYKHDYMKTETWLGFIPHKVLDEEKYNAALEEYEKKQRRDELRDRLSQLGGESVLSAAYDCHVYRDGSSKRLAQKVTPSGILASYKNGEAIVYEKTQLSAPKKVKFSELDVDFVMSDPASFFGQLSKSLSGSGNGEIKFAGVGEGKLRESDMGVMSVKSEVLFSEDGSKLYILEPLEQSGNLYCCTVNEAGLNMKSTIDSAVSHMAVSGANLYYVKGNSQTDASLYRYVTDKPEFIEDHIAAITATNDGNLLLYTDGVSNADETVIAVLQLRYGQEAGELSGQVKKIADNALCRSAVYYDDNSVLFTQQTDKGDKTFQWYHGKKKTKKLDAGADKVFLPK